MDLIPMSPHFNVKKDASLTPCPNLTGEGVEHFIFQRPATEAKVPATAASVLDTEATVLDTKAEVPATEAELSATETDVPATEAEGMSVTNEDEVQATGDTTMSGQRIVRVTAALYVCSESGVTNTGTTLNFGIEEQDDVDDIIDTILHSAPSCTIHSVYGNVVDDHHVVDVYPSSPGGERIKQGKRRNMWNKFKSCVKELFCFK